MQSPPNGVPAGAQRAVPDALVLTPIGLASKLQTVPINTNAMAAIRISWFSDKGF